jgi:hypothetical protein
MRGGFRLLTPTSLAVLAVAGTVVTVTGVERYRDPVGDKYLFLMKPGGADFLQTFAGARALARGENPYQNALPGTDDPWRRGAWIDAGTFYKVAYPPSQLLFYVPLARLVDDPRAAGRILFWANLALLMGLAVLTRWLLVRATDPEPDERRCSWLLVPLLYFVLTANVGTSLGLERGQSDIIGAALCWGGVALFLKGRRLLPALLITSAVLMKGYALVLGLGLALLSLRRREWLPFLAGALAAVAILLLPVAQYVDEGIRGARWQAAEFTARYWNNHGFKNLFHSLSPALAEPGRVSMTALALLASAACWLRARRPQEAPEAALWVSLFATCALTAPIGYSAASHVYNQVLLLPGAFILLLGGRLLAEKRPLSPAVERALRGAAVLAAFLLFKYRLGSERFPVAAVGLVLLVLMSGLAALRREGSLARPPGVV